MPSEACWLTSETDAAAAVARFLDDFAGPDRAQALHLVLKQLRRRVEPDRVLACELAWEVHAGSYWSQLRDDANHPYESEEAYFKDALGLVSWRTAYKRLAIGRMLSQMPAAERALVRAAVADAGVATTTVIAPAIGTTGAWATCLDLPRRRPTVVLHVATSE